MSSTTRKQVKPVEQLIASRVLCRKMWYYTGSGSTKLEVSKKWQREVFGLYFKLQTRSIRNSSSCTRVFDIKRSTGVGAWPSAVFLYRK